MFVRNVVKVCFITITAMLLLSSCTGNKDSGSNTVQNTTITEKKGEYMQITQEKAKNIMDTETGYILLDVRTEEEFAEGHIPGAVLIPDYQIGERAEGELTDKSQLILVYCRSGRRSKIAAEKLVNLGYTNVKEFGGIIDWPYETTKD